MNVSCCSIYTLAVLALVFITGCFGTGNPETVPVTGTVTYKGQPVENAAVVFTPDNGRSASGMTDASGKFKLMTFEPDDGAIPGEHKISIVGNANEIPGMDTTKTRKKGKADADAIPQKYADPRASGLKKSVVNGEANDFTFELE